MNRWFTNEDENRFDGSGEIRLKPAAASLPESRTPSPESRFSEEPFNLITDTENGHDFEFSVFHPCPSVAE
ncbi:MAG: hypothetical protein AB1422_17595 [bacterium]